MSSEKGHILIVDDQQNWLKALSTILKTRGFEVSIANNVIDAKAKIMGNLIDVVVIDVRLAEEDSGYKQNVDGIKLLRDIKKNNPNIQTIIITGYPNDVIHQDEPDRFFLKAPNGHPFDTKGFITTVQDLVKKSKSLQTVTAND